MPAKRSSRNARLAKIALLVALAFLLLLAGAEIFNLGWGSGSWLGRLSAKWAVTLFAFYVFFAGLFALAYAWLFSPQWTGLEKRIIGARKSLCQWRWLPAVLAALTPAWFVYYSPWGALFVGLFFRILVFGIAVLLVAYFLARSETKLITWQTFLLSGLAVGTFLVLAESFVLVTDYPFALHWSEGNRLWDYSVLFGRDRYNYSGEGPILARINPTRQWLWGLPFLIPQLPIWATRLWGAVLVTIPYALLGWAAFWPGIKYRGPWILAGFWALIFLNQGPIYTPLVLAAIIVALARRGPWWLALPLVYLSGIYASISRYTWSFAVGIWAVVLSLGDAVLEHGKLIWRDWLRSAALGLAGIWSRGLPILIGVAIGFFPFLVAGDAGAPSLPSQSVETLEGLQAVTTRQPFLWDRLFPNGIYPPGILLGLSLATLPLILLLYYLARTGKWKTTFLEQLVTIAGLGSMLLVGVIASAKVGGGTDLHNMDMFLVGLVLVAGLAWEGGLASRLAGLFKTSAAVRWLLAATIIIPAFMPMVAGRPLELPSAERTEFVLGRIQDYVACARQYGDVLFMDQRQLITFGLVGDVPLVVEYEKKFVMDQALAANEAYFAEFRSDLASGRFSLIVTEREALLYKEPDIESIGDDLIEENNAWVTWVTTPLLAYYESVADFKDAAIELFLPKERSFDCP
ncbi:MAG: hypothetical protein WD751_02425 [Anaerolineales bacterium]